MGSLRWLDGAQERVLVAVAAGKDVFCESCSPHPPTGFTIFREPPAVLGLPGVRRAWQRYAGDATLGPKATQFGTWVSDRPWQAPFGDQRLGSRRYRFFAHKVGMSPPLSVGHKVAFAEEHSAKAGVGAEGSFALEPASPSLTMSAETGRTRTVHFSGLLYAVEDPVIVPQLLTGEQLHVSVLLDLEDWFADMDLARRAVVDDLGWIAETLPPVEVEFSSDSIDLPEGIAKLVRGRAEFESEGPFAFAIELRDSEDDMRLLATSDPVAGVISSFNVVARWT